MQALKEAERAKQQLAEERAYQAQLLADKRKYDEGLLADERTYQEKLLADARLREDLLRNQDKQHAKELLQIQHKNAIELEDKKQKGRLELVKERHKGRLDKFNNAMTIVFQNQDYTYNAASKDNVVSKLLGVVKKYFTDANGYSSVLANIESSQMSEYGKRYETGNTVIAAMEELYNDFSAEDKNRIVEILNEYSVQNQDGATGGAAASAVGASAVKKKYKRTNADGSVTIKEMTDEEYNALDQSIRNLYTLVTE
jgi:DNA-binding PucR family transcriptional regulator